MMRLVTRYLEKKGDPETRSMNTTKTGYPKKGKKITSTRTWRMRKYQQQDEKKKKLIWSKIWERKEHKRNTECINNTKKELQGLDEDPKTIIHFQSLTETLKNLLNWNMQGQDNIHGFWH